ncbi:MAG TPA: hypothetical protein VG433_13400 [Pirellulales bacterium]|jgi:hypothetical protein|nr:hypothetical protein [Pirellulales bacterium]
MTQWLARLLGYRDVSAIEQISPSLAAPWAHEHPGLVACGCLLAAGLAIVFYLRFQPARRRGVAMLLAIGRAIALCLLLVVLAEPTLVVKLVRHPRPLVWLLFDGTDSMAIEDDLPESQRQRLDQAVGFDPSEEKTAAKHARIAYVQALLNKNSGRLLGRLDEKFRVRAFRFDRSDGVQALASGDQTPDAVYAAGLAQQLTTTGQVTALGTAMTDLARRHASSQVAGLVVFSDFDQNSGSAPLAAAKALGLPVYPVGVGPAAAVDLSVELQAPLLLKKGERTPLTVTLRHVGLEGQKAVVRLFARRMDATEAGDMLIGERRIVLTGSGATLDFDYTPEETGRMLLTAAVDPLEGEVIRANNRASREANVRDDFLRLMFVEYEPTWEWRFIKEVFHRDRLVGMRGFRTYLRSADPKVRQTNELFLSTMSPPRSDFFANDVIFLGDLPASALSPRFCELTKEFVSKFGGGLVVLSGPNFGPSQLAATPLGDMLPVIVDADSRLRDTRPFDPRLTAQAAHVDFMHLGANSADNGRAWRDLNGLPWYQPVARVHPLASVLLEHPQDTCVDGRTRQPLVAIRRYGRGEVVYLAMNETWRLRRQYGETYYRQFWGQMIHRLGLSHALGSQKRFVVRTDRQQYQADDKVTLSVEAYDEDFEPLAADKLADHKLWAELTVPGRAAAGVSTTAHPLAGDTQRREAVAIPETREGLFETQIPVLVPGEHRLRVKDPIAGGTVDVTFQVTSLSAERRSAVRNQELMDQLAAETGGASFDLTTAEQLPDEIKPHARKETMIEVLPVWNSWLAFGLLVTLLLGEWLLRKLVNLP